MNGATDLLFSKASYYEKREGLVTYELLFNEPNWPDMRRDCSPIDRCSFRYEMMPLTFLDATKRL